MDEDDGRPRGVKRKANDEALTAGAPRRIRALEQDVINKIAAGEIIVAPVHALKELTENAVDAGSTSVDILVKDGGLKMLQITDNGHGINREDLPILCERFTTSKLKVFEDLTSIGTYGFRGEALASISHIAHLTVTTKTKESSCAWKAQFSDGKLVPPKPGQAVDPRPCAGRPGTQITVEDLFYNVPTRRRAFRSVSEEYAKILDLIGRYAIHCSGVAFSCKKHGESSTGISVQAVTSTVDRIRQIHGSAVANELIRFEASNDRWGFRSECWISNANYHSRRLMLLLFINHRSVESSAIKKAVEQTYSTFLPKGSHPFVYLSLEIDPQRVDVNIHPTKREVNFLNEDEIIDIMTDEIRAQLGRVDTSRTFMTQSLLPGVKIPTISVAGNESPVRTIVPRDESDESAPIPRASVSRSSAVKPYENNLVRTDAKLRKITSMFTQSSSTTSKPFDSEGGAETWRRQAAEEMEYEYTDRKAVTCRLTTVKELRASVREEMHNELTEVFATHTFVGVVDERRRIAAIQGGVKLYLVDYGMICNEYFYQVGLTDFGNFGTIRLNPPLPLHDLLEIGAEHEKLSVAETDDDDGVDWKEVITMVEQQLMSRREMLSEYFAFEISESGELLTLPLLMKNYMPCLAKLPTFLLQLGPRVEWLEEKRCFDSFLRELASFYVPESLPATVTLPTDGEGEGEAEEDDDITSRRVELNRVIENVMFPAFKARLIATKDMLSRVVEVANLKGLYRVFERC